MGICEHFDLSRQELFDVVAVHGYRTFDDLVTAHGAAAAATCVSLAVASILASQLNGHVLDEIDGGAAGHQRRLPRQHPAQRHLLRGAARARRRDHPDKLIVIGEVARDFALYTKITGGQRIDLFGARLEQLPRSGAAWSTPGSSPATPTASRCAP